MLMLTISIACDMKAHYKSQHSQGVSSYKKYTVYAACLKGWELLSGARGASLKFCVTASGGPLKVTLVWNDKPNDLSAATQLVNDLDLIVYANSLNGYSRVGNGFPDHVNNVEQVSQSVYQMPHTMSSTAHAQRRQGL